MEQQYTLSINKHTTISKLNSIISIWPNIQLIIIDELSMVGCTLLAIIHLKLQKLKSNILPFGGINIMFMGDFYNFHQSMTHHYIHQTYNWLLHPQN
jgi:hypothetical protein